MAWKLISVIVAAALVAAGPAGAQTSSTAQGSQSDSGSAAATTRPEKSQSGSVQGSVTTDSPAASPSTMSSEDREAARARGVNPDKKLGNAVQEKVQEK